MKTTARLENAITKLYSAFHGNTLNPECCKQCAVGNILNNKDSWKHLSDNHGSLNLNYVGKVHEMMGRKFGGYSPLEILEIEATFLQHCGYSLPLRHNGVKPKKATDKEILFNGLQGVVEYLCKLDGVQNVMDYSRLFEYEKEEDLALA